MVGMSASTTLEVARTSRRNQQASGSVRGTTSSEMIYFWGGLVYNPLSKEFRTDRGNGFPDILKDCYGISKEFFVYQRVSLHIKGFTGVFFQDLLGGALPPGASRPRRPVAHGPAPPESNRAARADGAKGVREGGSRDYNFDIRHFVHCIISSSWRMGAWAPGLTGRKGGAPVRGAQTDRLV